ncbi:MAG: hypothetical protein M3Q06_13865 [Bacteroidota bacterium]|nr:hypothetical protein [Bacteroidota bacterium]
MTVTLQFKQLEELARFKSLLQTNNFELNSYNLTIICDCSENEINEAVNRYGAKLIAPLPAYTKRENFSSRGKQ